MLVLQRVLKTQAALWAVFGLALGLIPVRLLDLLGQLPVTESAWLRLLGIAAVVLAMQMWLVATALETVWWWAWSFVVLQTASATLAVINALFGLDPGAAAWPWWTLGGVSAAFAALGMLGLGRASQERPQV